MFKLYIGQKKLIKNYRNNRIELVQIWNYELVGTYRNLARLLWELNPRLC